MHPLLALFIALLIIVLWKICGAYKFFVKQRRRLARFIASVKRLHRQPQIEFKASFIAFFEGVSDLEFTDGYGMSEYVVDPVIPVKVDRFNITDFRVVFTNSTIKAKITLEKVGLLVGPSGKTIQKLEEFLSEYYSKPVIIEVKESKVWC